MGIQIKNTLEWTGDGPRNPAFNKQIKNLLLFHPTGARWWYDLEDERPDWASTWPLHTGRGPAEPKPGDNGYNVLSPENYEHQMQLIADMSENVAVACFLLPNDEAGNGYTGWWSPTQQWRKPLEQWDFVRNAAWKKGLLTMPFFSLNDFRHKGPDSYLGVLQQMTDAALRNDIAAVRDSQDRPVICIEGLPFHTNFEPHHRLAISQWLASRDDIVWIDNLLLDAPTYAENIYRSAAVGYPSGEIQEKIKSICDGRYLWTHTQRNSKDGRDIEPIPLVVQEKWLNINPHDPAAYPVVIYQWNEYSEWKVLEPNEFDQHSVYEFMKWMFSRQP